MLNLIIRFCVKEPWLVVLLTVGLSIAGWVSFKSIPIDAIPNIGENQVIVLTPWPGRSPKDIEDQVTYPLSVSLLAVPGAESVRGKSMFGYSFVQVTFSDNTDFYWARSRVAEQLGTAAAQLPDGVALGGEWAAVDRSHNVTLLEAPDLETVRRIQAPFEPFTDTTVVPVTEIRGWTAS